MRIPSELRAVLITATIKDAGDDRTQLMVRLILSELSLAPRKGVRFHAAQGVGTGDSHRL